MTIITQANDVAKNLCDNLCQAISNIGKWNGRKVVHEKGDTKAGEPICCSICCATLAVCAVIFATVVGITLVVNYPSLILLGLIIGVGAVALAVLANK